MKLPNGDGAQLGTKLEDYSLNPEHRQGRHKAHVFQSVLGVTPENAQILREAILNAAREADNVEARGDNGFGQNYVLRFTMMTDTGQASILTAWIIRHGEDFPRLTTCYIL